MILLICIFSPSSPKPPMLSTDGMSRLRIGSRHISLLSYITTVRTTIPVPVLL